VRSVRVYQCDNVDGCRNVRALQPRDYVCCNSDMCSGTVERSLDGDDDSLDGGGADATARSGTASERGVTTLLVVLSVLGAVVLACMAVLCVVFCCCADGADDDLPVRRSKPTKVHGV